MIHVMKVWAFVVAVAISFVGGRVFAQDAKVQRGMKVYEEQKCSLCHSIGGKGNQKGPLDGVGAMLTAEEIKAWITTPKEMTAKAKAERKPPMRAYPTLPADDVDALVAYLLTLKTK
jgi:mono/diheme cytochrome c family protein